MKSVCDSSVRSRNCCVLGRGNVKARPLHSLEYVRSQEETPCLCYLSTLGASLEAEFISAPLSETFVRPSVQRL